MNAICPQGETITLPDSAFLADLLRPGSGMPDAKAPAEVEVAPEVTPEQVRHLAKLVLGQS